MDDAKSQPRLSEQEFRIDLEQTGVKPLWERNVEGPHIKPKPLPPYHWPWTKMEPLIEAAAHYVPLDRIERRALTLMAPNLDAPTATTTTNLTGALHTLLEGERAKPHRHNGNALRVPMTGEGAVTFVNGKACPMARGDLILTPDWCWHHHEHRGKGQVVWFDALDVGLLRHMDAIFFEAGPPNDYPEEPSDAYFFGSGLVPTAVENENPYSPIFRYPWERTSEALEAMPRERDGARQLRYTNPLTGGPAMSRLELSVMRLGKGCETRGYRTLAEAICLVLEGCGFTTIGEHRIEWAANDVFSLPRWNWISHTAHEEPTTIFMVSDREAYRRLSMLREEFAI